jgi:hypothetical protein
MGQISPKKIRQLQQRTATGMLPIRNRPHGSKLLADIRRVPGHGVSQNPKQRSPNGRYLRLTSTGIGRGRIPT